MAVVVANGTAYQLPIGVQLPLTWQFMWPEQQEQWLIHAGATPTGESQYAFDSWSSDPTYAPAPTRTPEVNDGSNDWMSSTGVFAARFLANPIATTADALSGGRLQSVVINPIAGAINEGAAAVDDAKKAAGIGVLLIAGAGVVILLVALKAKR